MKIMKIVISLVIVGNLICSQDCLGSMDPSLDNKLFNLKRLTEQAGELVSETISIVESSKLEKNIDALVMIRGMERVETYLRDLVSIAEVFGYVKDSCKWGYFMVTVFPYPNSKEYLDSQMESIEKGFDIEGATQLVALINRARIIVESSKRLSQQIIKELEYRSMVYKEAHGGDCNLRY